MEEETIKKDEKQALPTKRNYTPPALTVYGKLAEVTGGGTTGTPEQLMGQGGNPKEMN